MFCPTGKMPYRSRLRALIALCKIQWQDDPAHQEKRVYQCRRCGYWHLTSQEEQKNDLGK